MTKFERRNYQIAVIISIVFHAILFFTYFNINPKPGTLDTFPVGMVELAPGSGGINAHPVGVTDIPGDQNRNTSKTEVNTHKPQPHKPAQPSSDQIPAKNLKIKEGIQGVKPKVSEPSGEIGSTGPGREEEHQTSGNPGNKNPDKGNSPGGQPIGFGTGEGMVSLGPVPRYPKNADNEGKEGEVAVRVLVFANGSLEHIEKQKSAGDPRLDNITIYSITNNWQFKSAPKDYYIDLIFVFNLQPSENVSVKFIKSATVK